ncbi:MAG: hypothetical protein K5880_16705 [Hydrogenophaga sp.]|jgi:hypothetical protein|uniref:ribonuclease toxin HepT-like protein n=1 Tax=Hydrogenophaga sp. TaxID=1904254 RepID=UPI00262776B0|nr:hypothetical protein [Hydrogenophaga sp.]MCV0440241.1 hypothetical protein [Hydrogenophaga sp.]
MLKRDFDAEMAKLEKELGEFERWEANNPDAGDWAYVKLAGATVNSVYTGMETILEAVLKRTDPPMEQDAAYHARLIKTAAAATPTRDPLISEELRELLDDLRGFRHVGRKRYGSEIDPGRTGPVLSNAKKAAPIFRREMTMAITALEEALTIAAAERLEVKKAEGHTKKRSG